jgi:dTDP-glucose 4,6-dehydratase
MKRVLLTGASGFIGSHVLRHILVNTDWEVVCPVSFTHKGIQDRIRVAVDGIDEEYNRVKVYRTDLNAPVSPVMEAKWGEINYVLNVAAESHVDRSIKDPANFILNNVALAVHLLDWARNHKSLEKFVQISTDEVYGPTLPNGSDHKEWVDLHLPSNPYAASKAAQEDIAFAYWRTFGVPVIITNTMNIIGETQDSEKFVPMIIKKVLNGETVTIHGDPKTGEVGSRYYMHARTKADALLYILGLDAPKFGEANKPERFNIVGHTEYSNLEIAQLIASFMNKELKYEIVDFNTSRPGHDLRYGLAGEKLSAAGWKPPVEFENSLKHVVDWTLAHPEWMKI